MAFKVNDKMLKNNSKLEDNNNVLEAKKNFKIEFIKLENLVPSDKNFYELVNIDELAEDIKLNGLNSNLVARPIKGGKYELIGGHRRYTALKKLVENGEKRFNVIPCQIKELDDIDMEIQLITDNANQRERTELEKLKEVEMLNKLYKAKKERGEEVGTIRTQIAKDTGLSESQVQRYTSVSNRLIEPLKDLLEEGKINISSANEFSKVSEESQLALIEIVKSKVEITKAEAEELKEKFTKLEKEKAKVIEEKTKELEKETKDKIKEKEEELKRATKENDTLKKNLDKSIENAKKEFEKELEQKKSEIKNSVELEFETEISKLQSDIKAEAEQKEKYKKELEELKAKKDNNEVPTESVKEDIEALKNSMKILTEMKNANDTIKRLSAVMGVSKKSKYPITDEVKETYEKLIKNIEALKKLM